MSEHSDDAFDRFLQHESDLHALQSQCKRYRRMRVSVKPCRFDVNDDGLYECEVCGLVTDL